jgi:hypothetical protein
MQAFDIRITGEIGDGAAAAIAAELIVKLHKAGASVHHASLNGQEVRVHVDVVEDPVR